MIETAASPIVERHKVAGSRKPIRARLVEQQHGRCFYCREVMNPVQPDHSDPLASSIDHRIPLVRGGTDHPDNLVAACVGCNAAKDDLTPEEFELALRFGLA